MTNDMPPPDRTEKLVRFGCGFGFGALVALVVLAELAWGGSLDWGAVGIGGVCGVIVGLAAVRWGNRFWRAVAEIMRWLRL